ncbi:hypothetical protein EXN22_16620 [Pseudomonas tructae]|uniref:Uncharacterized protein n=1 Tax=Pseudomonas tructae TaxID=2518644 RepID=A0A411MKB7_9PSED|nr:hypothetical protein [Pseudomonas tructae]QBF27232.1 hypothetical protein EXN22_16620 [Pseudomonas tructae]
MPTDRQLSFVATVRLPAPGKAFCVASTQLGRPFMSKIRRDNGIVSKTKNLANLVSLWDNSDKHLSLYFRHSNGAYRLYIRSNNEHYGKGLYLNEDAMLFARYVNAAPDLFQISDGKTHNLVVAPQATGASGQLYLYHRSRGLLLGSKTYSQVSSTFTAVEAGRTPLLLRIEITAVNAPYLSNPDEV